VEQSGFVKVFGESPLIKLLDFLLTERGLYDYSLTELAENSGVSWATLHKIFPGLIKLGVVKQTREIARAKLFRINEEHPIVKELIRMENIISDYFIHKELVKQGIEKSISLHA